MFLSEIAEITEIARILNHLFIVQRKSFFYRVHYEFSNYLFALIAIYRIVLNYF